MIPKLLSRKVIFEESFFSIEKDELQLEGRPPYSYFSLETPSIAVFILCVTPEGNYLLIEEYRHPTGKVLLSCPGGYINPGEDPLAGARRELMEETGYQADTLTMMGRAYPYAGFSKQQTIYVKATGVILAGVPQLEASEIIQTRIIEPQELNHLIKQDVALDGTLCTALFFNANNYYN